VNIPQER